MKIGFIGLGIMGRPMAKNLVKAGHELVVFDFNKDAVADLVSCGATAAESNKDLAAQVDVVITMVPNSPHVRAAVLGENGVVEGAKEGLVVIDMSSIDQPRARQSALSWLSTASICWTARYPVASRKQSTVPFPLCAAVRKSCSTSTMTC